MMLGMQLGGWGRLRGAHGLVGETLLWNVMGISN